MPLTKSPRLGLTRNDGADPFKRQDFLDNWDILDQYPGITTCTSTSRPSSTWPGRVIFETDTQRIVTRNANNAWVVPHNYPRLFTRSLAVSDNRPSGSSHQYNLTDLTIYRTCDAFVWGSIKLGQESGKSQAITHEIEIDGSEITFGHSATTRFGDSGTGASGQFSAGYPLFGYKTNLTGSQSGTNHTLSVQINVGTLTGDGVYVYGIKLAVLLVE